MGAAGGVIVCGTTAPICLVLAGGVLGYLGPVRSWRWSLEMIGTQMAATILFTGSGLSLWPLALVFGLAMAIPGILAAWLGALVHRFRTAMREANR